MPFSDAMICVAAPELPQIGSCTTGGDAGSGAAGSLTEPPHADKPPSRVAPADVPASTMNARRAAECGSVGFGVLDAIRLPLLRCRFVTDVSLPLLGVVSNRGCCGGGWAMHAVLQHQDQ